MGNRKIKKWNGLTAAEIAKLSPSAIERSDPERYKTIIRMLKEGLGVKVISRCVGCSHDTVYKIINQDPSLNKGLDVLTSKLNRSANQVLDRMVEVMDDEEAREKIGFKDLSVAAAVVTDKIEKLSQTQAPHTVTNVQINVNEAQEINDLIRSLPKEKRSKPGEDPQAIDAEEISGEK